MFNLIRKTCSALAPTTRKPQKQVRLGFECLEKRELRTPGLASSLLGGIGAISPAPALLGLATIPGIADTMQDIAIPSIPAMVQDRAALTNQAVQAPFQVAPSHVAPVDITSAAKAVVLHAVTGDGPALQADLMSAAETVVTQFPTSVQTGIAICLFVAMVDTYGNVATGSRGAADIQFDPRGACRSRQVRQRST